MRSDVIQKLYPAAVRDVDFLVADRSDGNGPQLIYWNIEKLGPIPTEEQINSVTVPAIKQARLAELDSSVRNYVYQHYEQHRQVTLTKLQMDAAKNNKTEAYNYIESCWDWIKSAFAVYYIKAAEINACVTSEAVSAVSWDLSVLDASDPGVTIQHAMELLAGN